VPPGGPWAPVGAGEIAWRTSGSPAKAGTWGASARPTCRFIPREISRSQFIRRGVAWKLLGASCQGKNCRCQHLELPRRSDCEGRTRRARRGWRQTNANPNHLRSASAALGT
ncbi:unnamed protein product, partial [Polarella glacialis]